MSNQINSDRRRFLGAAAMTMIAAHLGIIRCNAIELANEGNMPSLSGATEWLNSQRLTKESLHGKVVLIEFWTYSCINWRRTLPYVRAWEDKYKDNGLIVIGVHAPEFAFEKNVDNVRWATKHMKIDYPVAIDNDRAIWNAFNNEYWPALFFIDAEGHIRHHVFGEGEYEKSEQVIQHLLSESRKGGIADGLVSVDASGLEVGPDLANLNSPETYLGSERAEYFASPGGQDSGESRSYQAPTWLAPNQWSLLGNWTVEKQKILLNENNGQIACRFHARDLHLVMGPSVQGSSVRFRVLIDGHPPGASHGGDIDEQGNGKVIEPRLYQLIRQPAPIVDRKVEIEFLDPGIEAYSLTFG